MVINGVSLPSSILSDIESMREKVAVARSLYLKIVKDGGALSVDDVKALKDHEDDSTVILRNHTARVAYEDCCPDNGNSYTQELLYLEAIELATVLRRYARKALWGSGLTLAEAREMLK